MMTAVTRTGNPILTPTLSSDTNRTSHLGLSGSSESIVKARKSKNAKPNPKTQRW